MDLAQKGDLHHPREGVKNVCWRGSWTKNKLDKIMGGQKSHLSKSNTAKILIFLFVCLEEIGSKPSQQHVHRNNSSFLSTHF